jgi:hypothetical protein
MTKEAAKMKTKGAKRMFDMMMRIGRARQTLLQELDRNRKHSAA